MILVVHPGSRFRVLIFTHPGSRTDHGSQILIRNTVSSYIIIYTLLLTHVAYLEIWDLIRRPSTKYIVNDHNRRSSFNPISCILHIIAANPYVTSNYIYSRAYSSGAVNL
jgi:hypothetical protein